MLTLHSHSASLHQFTVRKPRRFYGKDVTVVSVTLFSVQTGADIPLPPLKTSKGMDGTAVSVTLFSVQSGTDIPLPPCKNTRILWQKSHFNFSSPDQCPIWSWYIFATLKEYKDWWQGCHCSFSDPVQCPIWSWYSFAILEEWKDFVAKKSLKFQWPCSVFNLEVIFLCNLGRIGGFYGKDVTAASVNLFSVQTGADIPLPPKRNSKILWKRIHCSFSDPVQCPTWSWYSFANWEE